MPSLRSAFIAFKRAPLLSALSVTTIAFSLFAFGLFGLVALNIRNALQKVEERGVPLLSKLYELDLAIDAVAVAVLKG